MLICYSNHRKVTYYCTCSELGFILLGTKLRHSSLFSPKFSAVQYQNPKFTIDSSENGAFTFSNKVGVGNGLMLTEPTRTTPFVSPARRAWHWMPPAAHSQPLKTEIENIPFEHPVIIIMPSLQVHPADGGAVYTSRKH